MREEWRDVPEYQGIYQVSNYGRVRSLDRYIIRNGSQALIRGRILRLQKDKIGYIRTIFCKNSKRKCPLVHRLVLTAFDRPPKEGEEGNHKDGNKGNNYRSNLEWCTPKQNCDHRDNVLNRGIKGERCHLHKLTDQKVREIKKLLKEGNLTQKQIAIIYHVKQSVISNIKLNKRWKHVR